jgi:hypothetical protein
VAQATDDRRRVARTIGVVALFVMVALAVGAPLASAHHAPKLRNVRLHFHSLGMGQVESDGRYVTITDPYAAPGTGQCVAVGPFGGPWLYGGGCVNTASQALTVPLYSLATGQTRFVTINGLTCGVGEGCAATAAGADWVGYQHIGYHELTESGYQNLQTGAISAAPKLTPSTRLDLNSPTLTAKICPPLRQGPDIDLTFYGQFAVEQHFFGHGASTESLVRCGSKLHIRLRSPLDVFGTAPVVIGSSSALMWPAGAHLLEGISLPSLVRFQIRTPSLFKDEETSFTLSWTTLYASDNQMHLYAAAWSPPR